MACVDENQAVALVEGRLSQAAAQDVHQHVAGCSQCRVLIAELAKAPTVAVAMGATMAASGGIAHDDTARPIDSATVNLRGPRATEPMPDRIGRYRVIEKLGEGGMGAVYAAEDPELHRRVAIKLLHSGTPDATERLLREARVMAKLRHPHVVTVYDVGRQGEDVYVAMELIEGVTLRTWLQQDHSFAERLDVLVQAGRGLAAAHEQGLVHRDFKPDNVMVGSDGRVQVLDFGLAKAAAGPELVGSDRPGGGSGEVELTQSGVMVGTPAYMAPEQFRLEPTDARTDQFAFCVALYEAVYGQRPFTGSNLAELQEAVCSGQFVEPATEQTISAAVRSTIRRGLSVDAGARFADMGALLAVLQPKAPGRRSRRLIAMGAGAVVASVAITALVLGNGGADTGQSESEQHPYASILAGSDLPSTLADPVSEDPLRVTVHRLSNGLTVYISPNRKEPRIRTQLTVRAGGRDDPDHAGGLAHMVEHMMFKGTERLGTKDFAAEAEHLKRLRALYARHAAADSRDERDDLMAQIDAATVEASAFALPNEFVGVASLLGIDGVNGYATHDTSSFVADVPSHRFALWAKLEGERWTRPVFRLFHPEVATIFAERRRLQSAAETMAMHEMYAALFPKHPYGEMLIGSYQDIRSEPFTELERFFDTWYVPNNAALFLAGDIDADTALPVLEREFGTWQPRRTPERRRDRAPPLETSRVIEVASGSERFVMVAWRTVPAGHADEDALRILAELIGGEGGLAAEVAGADIQTWATSMAEGGLFAVFARPRGDQSLEEAAAMIDRLVARVANGDFEAERLDAVVRNYRVALARSYEHNDSRLAFMAYAYERQQDWTEAWDWQSRLAGVDSKTLARVADSYLRGPRVTVRAEPGVRPSASDEQAPVVTPLDLDTDGRSAFAEQILAAEVVELPLRFVWRGRDFELRESEAGEVIAVGNRDNDLYELRLRWQLGSRHVPLLCAALHALDSAGYGKLTAVERKRRWYETAMHARIACQDNVVEVRVSGTDRYFDDNLAEVLEWLTGSGLETADWPAGVQSYANQRASRAERERLWALDAWAARGSSSSYLSGLSDQQLRASSVEQARAALARLMSTRRAVLYFGPRPIQAIEAGQGRYATAPERTPVRYREADERHVWVLDSDDARSAGIVVRVPIGPIDEDDIVLIEVLETYLSDSLDGRLTEVVRHARGMAYDVSATIAIPTHPDDHASLLVHMTTEVGQAAEAIELVMAELTDMNITPGQFERAVRRTEEDYRADWIAPRDLPLAIHRWRRLGLDADPRPTRFTRLGQLSRAEFNTFVRTVAQRPAIISVVGKMDRMDLDALRALGQLEVMERAALSRH